MERGSPVPSSSSSSSSLSEAPALPPHSFGWGLSAGPSLSVSSWSLREKMADQDICALLLSHNAKQATADIVCTATGPKNPDHKIIYENTDVQTRQWSSLCLHHDWQVSGARLLPGTWLPAIRCSMLSSISRAAQRAEEGAWGCRPPLPAGISWLWPGPSSWPSASLPGGCWRQGPA